MLAQQVAAWVVATQFEGLLNVDASHPTESDRFVARRCQSVFVYPAG
ncbi:hypothetical protein FHW64_006424 [Variovorax sp. Sphag1AA]|nr:hypothetical protein [Variovorax sp. Sphag1AA]